MRNTQAWVWLTAGVVALGLNGFYHDGGAAWAHQVAEGISVRADYAIERVSGRAEQLLAKAEVVADRQELDRQETGREEAGRQETAACPISRAVARVQARMARAQTAVAHFDAMSAREQAQIDRWQAQQDRIQARVQAQVDRELARARVVRTGMDSVEVDPMGIRVTCPRARVRVATLRVPAIGVPAINVPAISVPEVRIPEIDMPHVRPPQIPAVRITAPVISADESDSGPI